MKKKENLDYIICTMRTAAQAESCAYMPISLSGHPPSSPAQDLIKIHKDLIKIHKYI